MSQRMPIGTVSRLARVRVATIRYYEGMSLLPVPSRTDANRHAHAHAGADADGDGDSQPVPGRRQPDRHAGPDVAGHRD